MIFQKDESMTAPERSQNHFKERIPLQKRAKTDQSPPRRMINSQPPPNTTQSTDQKRIFPTTASTTKPSRRETSRKTRFLPPHEWEKRGGRAVATKNDRRVPSEINEGTQKKREKHKKTTRETRASKPTFRAWGQTKEEEGKRERESSVARVHGR